MLPATPPPMAPKMVATVRPPPLPTWLPITAPRAPPATVPTPLPAPFFCTAVTVSTVPQLAQMGLTGAGWLTTMPDSPMTDGVPAPVPWPPTVGPAATTAGTGAGAGWLAGAVAGAATGPAETDAGWGLGCGLTGVGFCTSTGGLVGGATRSSCVLSDSATGTLVLSDSTRGAAVAPARAIWPSIGRVWTYTRLAPMASTATPSTPTAAHSGLVLAA